MPRTRKLLPYFRQRLAPVDEWYDTLDGERGLITSSGHAQAIQYEYEFDMNFATKHRFRLNLLLYGKVRYNSISDY